MADITVRVGRGSVTVRENALDRLVGWIDPVRAQRRLQARLRHAGMMALAGGYTGARTDRRATSAWKPKGNSADTDLLPDLPTLRERSRDLVRNNPLASGAINTMAVNVVGTGLMCKPNPDREALGWTEEEAATWAKTVNREWRPWAESTACDITRTQTFYGLQDLAAVSAMENGDVLALLPYKPRTDSAYQLAVQLIEADRVTNKDSLRDTPQLAGGVQMDEAGAPVAYHILTQHPGDVSGKVRKEWQVVPAFGGATGRRNVLHVYRKRRVGQSRGAPLFAPVIEMFKQLGTYTDSEVFAAVLTSMVAITTKTDDKAGLTPLESAVQGSTPAGGTADAASSSWDGTLTPGLAVDLGLNEEVAAFKSEGRPNPQFDPFVQALLRQVGVGLGLPFEVLIKHFTASYSAARAALLDAWRTFRTHRAWLVEMFCQPVYEAWLEEAVALGRVQAPGFFDDPALRAAYCRANWHGDGPGAIDPLREAEAIAARLESNITTLEGEIAEYNGGDANEVLETRGREKKKARATGAQEETPAKPAEEAGRKPKSDREGKEDSEARMNEELVAAMEQLSASQRALTEVQRAQGVALKSQLVQTADDRKAFGAMLERMAAQAAEDRQASAEERKAMAAAMERLVAVIAHTSAQAAEERKAMTAAVEESMKATMAALEQSAAQASAERRLIADGIAVLGKPRKAVLDSAGNPIGTVVVDRLES